MLPGTLFIGHIKSPHSVIARNFVGEALPDQPFQYPVYSDTVNNITPVKKARYFMMRQRAPRLQ